jgi:hypothetical protein
MDVSVRGGSGVTLVSFLLIYLSITDWVIYESKE